MAHLPLKMRHQRTGFLQSGQQTIAGCVAGALPTASTDRYVYASYIDEPVMRWQTSNSARVYYHRNQQYSVTALTNNTGAVLERYAYTAYGVPTITTATGTLRSVSAHANRYLYTGREWDPTIFQYHYRARMYDANLGRFCSRDPVGSFNERTGSYGIANSILVSTNPSGTHDQPAAEEPTPKDKVEIVVKGTGSKKGGCGARSFRNWKFSIRGKPPCEEGFLVQKVWVSCFLTDCNDCSGGCGERLSSGAFSYYESWYLKDGNVQDRRGYTESAQYTAQDESCGRYTQTGEIRFYCMSITGDLGRVGKAGKWELDQTYGNDFGCSTSPGKLPSTGEKPSWWGETSTSGVASAEREFSMDWDCCDKNKVNVSYKP